MAGAQIAATCEPDKLAQIGGKLPPSTCMARMGERHAAQQSFQEGDRAARIGPRMGLHHVPARDEVACREVLQNHTACRTHLLGVQGHQIARLAHPPKTRLACGPRPMTQLAAWSHQRGVCGASTSTPRRFRSVRMCPIMEVDVQSGPVKKNVTQLVLAPARVLAAQEATRAVELVKPTNWDGGVGAGDANALLAWSDKRIIAAPPAVEALPADAEMATGDTLRYVRDAGSEFIHSSRQESRRA